MIKKLKPRKPKHANKIHHTMKPRLLGSSLRPLAWLAEGRWCGLHWLPPPAPRLLQRKSPRRDQAHTAGNLAALSGGGGALPGALAYSRHRFLGPYTIETARLRQNMCK